MRMTTWPLLQEKISRRSLKDDWFNGTRGWLSSSQRETWHPLLIQHWWSRELSAEQTRVSGPQLNLWTFWQHLWRWNKLSQKQRIRSILGWFKNISYGEINIDLTASILTAVAVSLVESFLSNASFRWTSFETLHDIHEEPQTILAIWGFMYYLQLNGVVWKPAKKIARIFV